MIINRNILFILFTDDFYKCYYALNLASTYQHVIKTLPFSFLDMLVTFLRNDWSKYDKLKISKKFSKKK